MYNLCPKGEKGENTARRRRRRRRNSGQNSEKHKIIDTQKLSDSQIHMNNSTVSLK